MRRTLGLLPLALLFGCQPVSTSDPPSARIGAHAFLDEDDQDDNDCVCSPCIPGERIRPQSADAELRDIVASIDRQHLFDTVQTLVAFGTRHTLSTQDDPNRGIGAATNWIFDQLSASAAMSDG